MTEQSLSLTCCGGCGGPLSLRASARFITCERCGADLRVISEGSATFAEAMVEAAEHQRRRAELSQQLRR